MEKGKYKDAIFAAVRGYLFFLARRGYLDFWATGYWIESEITVVADAKHPPDDAVGDWEIRR